MFRPNVATTLDRLQTLWHFNTQ